MDGTIGEGQPVTENPEHLEVLRAPDSVIVTAHYGDHMEGQPGYSVRHGHAYQHLHSLKKNHQNEN